MATKQDELETMLDDIQSRESKLNDWETSFIESVGERITDDKPLSEAQEQKFCDIWDKVT